jgi:hypothetical protein
MRILFNGPGKPIKAGDVKKSINAFGNSYNVTVQSVIDNSVAGLGRRIFFENVAILMPNFKMTRAGPFQGVTYSDGRVQDPNGQISSCWKATGADLVKVRKVIDAHHRKNRSRVLVEMPESTRKELIAELWEIFKKLEAICRGKTTFGMVAASKVLFAVLPEVALPIDNSQWIGLFDTIDYGDIIRLMAAETRAWEKDTGQELDSCYPRYHFTLPSIYNVMAMKARP